MTAIRQRDAFLNAIANRQSRISSSFRIGAAAHTWSAYPCPSTGCTAHFEIGVAPWRPQRAGAGISRASWLKNCCQCSGKARGALRQGDAGARPSTAPSPFRSGPPSWSRCRTMGETLSSPRCRRMKAQVAPRNSGREGARPAADSQLQSGQATGVTPCLAVADLLGRVTLCQLIECVAERGKRDLDTFVA